LEKPTKNNVEDAKAIKLVTDGRYVEPTILQVAFAELRTKNYVIY